MKPPYFIISCEHAVNTIPSAYQHLFHQQEAVLDTHRGIDFGALEIARDFSKTLDCPLVETTSSRLLIDCNRCLTHRHCFSEFTKGLSRHEKQQIIDNYYLPFRQKVEALIHDAITQEYLVIHLSIHSFTPILNNKIRNTDIGFLYDPRRFGEKQVAAQWRARILEENTDYRIRMNYPYHGISNCFVSTLRKRHREENYLGFEVEGNQSHSYETASLKALSQRLISGFMLSVF